MSLDLDIHTRLSSVKKILFPPESTDSTELLTKYITETKEPHDIDTSILTMFQKMNMDNIQENKDNMKTNYIEFRMFKPIHFRDKSDIPVDTEACELHNKIKNIIKGKTNDDDTSYGDDEISDSNTSDIFYKTEESTPYDDPYWLSSYWNFGDGNIIRRSNEKPFRYISLDEFRYAVDRDMYRSTKRNRHERHIYNAKWIDGNVEEVAYSI